jgi:hypothetical protein
MVGMMAQRKKPRQSHWWWWGCCRCISRRQAILYRGVVPMLLRAFPANSVALATIESTRAQLQAL